MEHTYENDIAIIGMAGRFPKAKDLNAYWQNLIAGVNSISQATDEQLLASGIPKEISDLERFVKASSKLEDAKYFDADFFELSNAEVMLMDPQIRLLLQTSWHALEDAGYANNNLDVSVGNFCGMSTNTYLMKMMSTNAINESFDPLLYRILNEKDFLATWISYKLNLTGPAMTIQTACSTSLLATHLACQSLLNHECSMALAGGVSYNSDHSIGYMHMPESIYSKDGVCRPFDSKATGTVMGDGVGTIVLKRAEDAIKDKDHIYAIIRGTAANNDGSDKQGYTTPSVNFQRDVILEALAVSDINPETIGMIEAHGTGTLIGDPIEVTALTEAYNEYTQNKQYCAIGSVKSNIGHLDAAAGIASIIKTALCIHEGHLVPSISFSTPNPSLALEKSPFYVSQKHTAWPDHFQVKRAGITSLGVGGTNVHIIMEEAPQIEGKAIADKKHSIVLSAKNKNRLAEQKEKLANHIKNNPEIQLNDLEFTTLYGRKTMSSRFSLVCENKEELLAQLTGEQHDNCYEGEGAIVENIVVFPGQGAQYTNMALELYTDDETFRSDMDYCFEFIKSAYNLDIKNIIFSDNEEELSKTEHTQIVVFIVEYCLAKRMQEYGVKPTAYIGHSIGEYAAACMANCISLDDALKLVYHRGKLMGSMPVGSMLLVKASKKEVEALLINDVTICVHNTHDNFVIGGTKEKMQQQAQVLEGNQVTYRKLKVSHAYHTSMMENVITDYKKVLNEVEFKPLEGTKIFSTFTGDLVESALFCSPQYWLDQIIHPVKFCDAIENTMRYFSNPVFIETGPGSGLSSFINSIANEQANMVVLLPKPSKDKRNNLKQAIAKLYAKGVLFQSPKNHAGKRISLPGYSFAKNYFWKPKLNIGYTNFEAVTTSYHNTNANYQSNRLKTVIEIKTQKSDEISKETLEKLHELQTNYTNEIKKLFASENGEVISGIEVLYDEVLVKQDEDDSATANKGNSERKTSSVFVAPVTENEKIIAIYWETILGYSPAGVLDNYFEVGGNSLLATQLINKIIQKTGIEISIAEVLSYNTIKDLALLVEEKQWLGDEKEFSNEIVI